MDRMNRGVIGRIYAGLVWNWCIDSFLSANLVDYYFLYNTVNKVFFVNRQFYTKN